MRRTIAQDAKSAPGAAAAADNLPGGMALLGAVEFALSFAVIYTVIQASSMLATIPAFVPAVIQALPRGPAEVAAFLTITLGTIAICIGLYRPEVCRDHGRLALAAAMSTAAAFTVISLLAGSVGHGLTTDQMFWTSRVVGAWVITIGLIRVALGFVMRHRQETRRIMILGHRCDVERLGHRLKTRMGRRFEALVSPEGTVDTDQGEWESQRLEWTSLARRRLWAVVAASQLDDSTTEVLLDSKLRGLRVISGADFQERSLGRIDLDTLTHDAFLTADGFTWTRLSDRVKRFCDIVISLAMLALTLPLMLITALVIKADSAGPILYRQTRIGALGRPFTVFKFRSMTADAEASGKPRWAQKQDPRITRVGRFIRVTRIDELPQLINIIRGEMSLVGPRPERPHFVDQLTKVIPFYRQRSYVKPGLTGWAQVNYPYGASVEDAREKLAYDLYYVKHRSIWLDLRILFATIRVVISREGAR